MNNIKGIVCFKIEEVSSISIPVGGFFNINFKDGEIYKISDRYLCYLEKTRPHEYLYKIIYEDSLNDALKR